MAQHSYIVYQTLFHVIWFHRDRQAIEINLNHWNWLISRWKRWTIVVREKNKNNTKTWMWPCDSILQFVILTKQIQCSMLYWKSIQIYDGSAALLILFKFYQTTENHSGKHIKWWSNIQGRWLYQLGNYLCISGNLQLVSTVGHFDMWSKRRYVYRFAHILVWHIFI